MNEVTKCDLKSEDIIRLALEHFGAVLKPSDLEVKLAALAVAAEREACAKVCEEKKSKYEERSSKPEDARDIDSEVARIAKMTCDFNAAAIRARGEV